MHEKTVFVCGSAENEAAVWDLFDHMICLVADNETLRDRLATRAANAFGRHPEELAAALGWNEHVASRYRRLSATIIDGTQPPPDIVDAILVAAARIVPRRRPG
jgi:hypothetical protein